MACLQVFQVWHDRDILAKKVLEPHLEQLKSHPVVAPPAEEPDVLMEPAKLDDFGCAFPASGLQKRPLVHELPVDLYYVSCSISSIDNEQEKIAAC